MIREMFDKPWVDHPPSDAIIVPVAVANPASWRALVAPDSLRSGPGISSDNPIDDGRHHVFRTDRPQSGASHRHSDEMSPL
jgi:aminoglycoside 6'-N-acetyltransferase